MALAALRITGLNCRIAADNQGGPQSGTWPTFFIYNSASQHLGEHWIMHSQAKLSCASEILAFRERYREEMNCQIVHDSIHRRTGWTLIYVLELNAISVGFGSVAIGGPWKNRPTLLEFYVLPQYRSFSFDLFETLLSVSGPQFMEIQSNDLLPTVMLHTYAHEIASEKIVFHDKVSTALAANGATLRRISSDEETGAYIEQRQGGPAWVLELDGKVVAQGGILFHYNRPYGDIHMEVAEAFRRRGLGSYLVQELKRAAYGLGSIPCARCDTTNVPSRRTLQKAGLIPFAHMLTGVISAGG
jgi:GNAT superfamily N-acetyltransferase